ncbi:MAG: hypothetical protein NTX65_04315 [Ignavibacteriales bacterium]|nr:hypothetical protein [Ignavibacteriales bacterium]
MKNNDDRILKYLSELMDLNGRAEFEKELSNSEELRNYFDLIKNQINNAVMAESTPVDERYFVNLLPRIHKKMEKRNKFFSWKTVYYTVPTAAAILVFTLLMVNPKQNFDASYKDLANEVVNNFSDHDVSDNYFADLESNPADDLLTPNNDELNIQIPSDLDINSESYTKLIDNPVSEDYSTLNRLSDKELEIVYEKLNSANAQKVIK